MSYYDSNELHSYLHLKTYFLKNFHLKICPPVLPPGTPKDPTKIFLQILHPSPQNRSQTTVCTQRHLMAVPKTTINDVLGILNAINKWAYSSRNIATVALKGLITVHLINLSAWLGNGASFDIVLAKTVPVHVAKSYLIAKSFLQIHFLLKGK
jgi:hypothetical protein